MTGLQFLRRHRTAIASQTALVLAAGAVLAYAVAADGYQAHEARLNDGGIWVVNRDDGLYGRGQQAHQPARRGRLRRSQRPAAGRRPGRRRGAGRRRAGEHRAGGQPGHLRARRRRRAAHRGPPRETCSSPGARWDRWTPRPGGSGRPGSTPYGGRSLVTSADRQSDPVDEVGGGAALAVSQAGTVVVTSATERTVTYLGPGTGARSRSRAPRTSPPTPASRPR